jgi:hypothetical protein
VVAALPAAELAVAAAAAAAAAVEVLVGGPVADLAWDMAGSATQWQVVRAVKWVFAVVGHEYMLVEKAVAVVVAAKAESRSFEFVAWVVEMVVLRRSHRSKS